MMKYLARNPALSGGMSFIGLMFAVLFGITAQILYVSGVYTVATIAILSVSMSFSLFFVLMPLLAYMKKCDVLAIENSNLELHLDHYRDHYLDRSRRHIGMVSGHHQTTDWTDDDIDSDGQGGDTLRRMGVIN